MKTEGRGVLIMKNINHVKVVVSKDHFMKRLKKYGITINPPPCRGV